MQQPDHDASYAESFKPPIATGVGGVPCKRPTVTAADAACVFAHMHTQAMETIS